MAGIDENIPFYPLRIAVLTISDSRDEATDKSGALLAERLAAAGHELAGKAIVRDDVEAIRATMRAWAGGPWGMSGRGNVGGSGRVRMVDVCYEEAAVRTAGARGLLCCRAETLEAVRAGSAPRGSVSQTAELAGIMAAKRTASLIP